MDEAKAGVSSWLADSGKRQVAFVGGLMVLVFLLVGGVWWWLRPEYQVLFGHLREQDAATIVAELDRQKLSYQLADGGTTVMVPQSEVHGTRLKVMSRELPLKGTVGFELFNNADLGLTEFAQKVNYQRALQGELARTIMSLAEIESARVHLSLPEAGLFRRSGVKPRASVALMTKAGQDLPGHTVGGIQRLVAAAVPEMEPQDVTIIDSRGAAMGGRARAGDVVSDRRLELKIELEQYYARKVAQQLEAIVGAGNASISVDVQLNFDQVRITNESTGATATARRLPRPESGGKTLEAAFSMGQEEGAERPRLLLGSDPSTRRLEQIVASPGSVKRLNVGVLLQSVLDASAMEQVRQLVIATAGLSVERGDAVVVFARDRFAAGDKVAALGQPVSQQLRAADLPETFQAPMTPTTPMTPTRPDGSDGRSVATWVSGAMLLLLLCAAGLFWLIVHMRGGRSIAMMSPVERERHLQRLREALAHGGDRARP